MNNNLAKALAHPLRRQIFALLGERPASAKQLSAELDERLSSVAYHFRRLDELGLIRLVKVVQKRGATEKIFKAVKVVPLSALTRRELPSSIRDHVSAPILQMIFDRGVAALNAGTLDARDDSHLVCLPAVLDAEGWKDVAAIMDRALTDIAKARTRSSKRLSSTGKPGIRTTIVVASFESPGTLS